MMNRKMCLELDESFVSVKFTNKNLEVFSEYVGKLKFIRYISYIYLGLLTFSVTGSYWIYGVKK